MKYGRLHVAMIKEGIMEAYTDFASVYDIFMDDVPYEEWCERIVALLDKYDEKVVPEGDEALASEAGLLVDLGCGTGTLTRMLAGRGYDCIGIDNSYEMLEVARSKGGNEIMYLCQDMREFELYSTVGTIISVCDSVNYLLTEDDLLATFKLVNNYLYPRGLFIFDFNTVHKYRDVIGDTTIAENREDGSFIWENYYDEESQINEYDLTIYQKASGDDSEEHYVRSEETHIQRGYELDTMIDLIKEAGLEVVLAYDVDALSLCDEGATGVYPEVTEDTERVCIVAREVSK